MDTIKTALLEATHAAGDIIKSRFQSGFQVHNKPGINNLVTEVDLAAEAAIIEVISRHFPDHSVLCEESGAVARDSEFQWIADPIDGTTNFAHGVPLCCVSIAVKKGDDLLAGAIYNPMMNELYYAEKGGGATLNGQRIRVSEKTDFDAAFVVTGFPYHFPEGGEHPVKAFERFILKGLPVRRLGSAALDLCWVAAGRFDGFWEYNLSPWDIAAGYLLVREAGGRVTNFAGEEASVFDKETLATNGHIHEPMRALIKGEAISSEQ